MPELLLMPETVKRMAELKKDEMMQAATVTTSICIVDH